MYMVKSSPQRAFQAFVVGSSVLAVGLTLAYTGRAWTTANMPRTYPFVASVLLLPVVFGLSNMLVNSVQADSSRAYTLQMLIFGAVFGLGLSTVGRFVVRAPEKLRAFGWPDKKWLPTVAAPVLYALVWGVLINLLNRGAGIANIASP